jgi:hypothetical protein
LNTVVLPLPGNPTNPTFMDFLPKARTRDSVMTECFP